MMKSALTLAAFLVLSVWTPIKAWADDPDLAACADVVGTFLTLRQNPTVTGPERVGRNLLSLTNGGHAFLTDSAGGGVEGFQPFSDGRGAWRCDSTGEGEKESFTALVLDFAYPTHKFPNPHIARLDIVATYDSVANSLTGTTTIRFAPLDGDPMDESSLSDTITYDFTGFRIAVPE